MEESVSSIVFILTAYLSIPDIEVRPAIDEVQTVLVQAGKIILSVSKGVATWKKSIKNAKIKNASGKNGNSKDTSKGDTMQPGSESSKELKLYSAKKEEKPVITEKPANFFKSVSESKEVSKMYSMLSGCMQGVKMEFTIFSRIWDPYRYLSLSYYT